MHGTKKLRDRVRGAAPLSDDETTTALGNWYATVLFWQPQVALVVNEPTLLPVLLPFAPVRTLVARFRTTLPEVLGAHGVDASFIDRETTEMAEHRIAPTANRSVVGIMNEFAFLADIYASEGGEDLHTLALHLARTPCSPLHKRHVSPDRELAALVAQQAG